MRKPKATIRGAAALALSLSAGAATVAIAGGLAGGLAGAPAGAEAHAAEATAESNASPRLLVLLRDASALAVVDPAAGTVLGQVPTVNGPHEVTATPDGRLAFVASPSEGISVIDLEAMTELRRLDIGAGSVPHDVRFAGGRLYFTVEGYKAIGRYEFLFVAAPLRIEKGMGSPLNPIATF